jgi:Flavodoxin domain
VRSVVVYESWYGNTQRIADAVGEALLVHGEVAILSVDDPLPDLEGVDLLVVGAPTHVHGLSSRSSRKSAIDPEAGEPGDGARGWLDRLPGHHGLAAAAFDTRFERSVLLTGSAAHRIARRLRRHEFFVVAPPESFFVVGSEGPLKDGELERASAWAHGLATADRLVSA